MTNLENELIEIIRAHPYIQQLFEAMDHYIGDCYIGAGVITQPVWNKLHDFDLTYGIDDADIIYFNPPSKGLPGKWK
ncbi:hypothetical protein SAMN05216353_1804 [Halobacillus alkaliphilus]|uniref:Uncharacterized protein n=1 Tax=Halobacillus alkaliphilus TaxID=396056 RepID=A0A1I2TRM9_9BACI|nr:nucleotidyltransferase family protein [Halobacillus alkaliphilus]SFG67433.1 hypothetical protein SAMN05216353_1804 [Halobacillus alkaliphilus]